MKFTLALTMSGLLALSPFETNQEAYVFAVNTKSPPDHPCFCGLAQHTTYLNLSLQHIDDTDKAVLLNNHSAQIITNNEGNHLLSLPIDGMDIALDFKSPISGPLKLRNRPLPGKRRPSAWARSDFRWIPNMRDIQLGIASYSILKESLLSSNYGGNDITARLHLTRGKVSTARLDRTRSGKYRVWNFEPKELEQSQQTLAGSFVNKVRARESMSIILKEFYPSTSDPLTITLRPKFGGDIIEASLTSSMNGREPPTTTQEPSCPDSEQTRNMVLLKHFRWFYRLTREVPCPGQCWAPYYIGEIGDLSGQDVKTTAGGDIFCPGVTINQP